MDHPCAFGAADEVNSIPGHLEPSRRGFRARVRGADRQRQFRERARGGATKPRDDRQGAKNFVQRQRHAEAATSLERIARSSAPVFFKPQAVAAKRNPRGKEASESACFINGTSV